MTTPRVPAAQLALVGTSGAQQTLARARSALGRRTVYVLSKGGMDPCRPLAAECDCSGFSAWALGIPRQLPSGEWVSTDEIAAGGTKRHPALFLPVAPGQAQPGDYYVYGDHGQQQGHVGIVSEVRSGLPVKVIHCSSGNSKRGDAVQETGPEIWRSHPRAKVVRPHYAAIRRAMGLVDAPPAPLPSRPPNTAPAPAA